LIFEQIDIFLSSARTVSSSQDFGVEQFFRADEFQADDPSPCEEQKRQRVANLETLRLQSNKGLT
jgi:hypothetical protein